MQSFRFIVLSSLFMISMAFVAPVSSANAEETTKNIALNHVQTVSLSEIVSNGRFLILNDGSVWEIHPSDQVVAREWLTPSVITVKATQDETFPFELKNEDTQSSVKAKKSSIEEIYLLIEEQKSDEGTIEEEKIIEEAIPAGKPANPSHPKTEPKTNPNP